MTEELYVYDEASGHLFCKYCRRNYLNKEHNENCQVLHHDELTRRCKPPDGGVGDG
ncbi:hypothetical protein KD050_18540 [Psychrobacillus sp. INOP01]|uniref:hypothetical protein n=1 Tax=Psychrobacillus sp. INOP01 TaxID=2829187 RepID=UPI001BAA08D0|nr:hypothetical protein [Psychrobacillus sp. INOP01]QUG41252.1 hypothetical protein KD050_18540 [Psychrobacillus sp. INOP01]